MEHDYEVECTNCHEMNRIDYHPDVGDYMQCDNCDDEFQIDSIDQIIDLNMP